MRYPNVMRLTAIAAFCGACVGNARADPSGAARADIASAPLCTPSYVAALTPRAQDAVSVSDPRVTVANAQRWHEDVGVRTRLFLGASVVGVATYGAIKWWDSGFSGDFRRQSEGWFGPATEKGGADKLGHAFGAYTGVRAGAQALELLGNSRDDALTLALATSLAVFTGIEVLDGLSKSYKFSKEDAVANIAGAGFGWLLQKYPRLDGLIDFRLYYRQSPEAKAEGQWEPFADYNGQKYLLALKASGIPRLDANPVLRYVELVFGYGVRGYDPPGVTHSRHVYGGVALNVSRLLDDTAFRERRDTLARKGTGLFLELFQLPGTVALANHRL